VEVPGDWINVQSSADNGSMAAVPSDPLNAAQSLAAHHGSVGDDGRFASGPLLIIAGAGTGKTATLAHRVAHLLLAGVDPARMLLLTFSRRAAAEMTRRAERIVAAALATRSGGTPPAVRLPWAGTFHSVASQILRRHAHDIGLDPGFSIIDRGDAADLLDVVRHEQGLSAQRRRFPRKDTCLAIYSHRVNTLWPLKRTLEEHWPWCVEFEPELMALMRAYVLRKQAENLLDYDDLLLYWHGLLKDPALARTHGAQFDHVLVDEYQDTNTLQDEIVRALKPDGEGVTVVGDDAQSIYSFRAASVDNILEFPARFTPPATVIALEENYRSTQGVLDTANALIGEASRQYRKQLVARRGAGARPRLVTVADDRAQADYVVAEVLAAREAGVDLRRQAVLFRSGSHSAQLELELMRRKIPFVKYGGLKFLEAAHIKDVLACLRWIDNPRHRLAAFRVLQLMPGMGPGFSDRCFAAYSAAGFRPEALESFKAPAAARDAYAGWVGLVAALGAADAPWAGQLERVCAWYRPLLEARYEAAAARVADLDQLTRLAGQYPDRERFLTELTLDPPQATGDLAGPPLLDEDFLILSTVHSAKGLEWNSVYVLNVADGNFPNEFAGGKPEQLEEERRLLYVAITRARDALHLLQPLRYYVPEQPRYGDRHVYGATSRFLTAPVLATLDRLTWPAAGLPDPAGLPAQPAAVVDVAAGLRALWE
jgi:DNA helicase II / ATP-dependent DNA helicase PcrA